MVTREPLVYYAYAAVLFGATRRRFGVRVRARLKRALVYETKPTWAFVFFIYWIAGGIPAEAHVHASRKVGALPDFRFGDLDRLGARHLGINRHPLAVSVGIPYNLNVRRFCAMREAPQRTARVEARIAPEALRIVRRAAELQGRSLSDFVVAAAQEVAHRTIEEAQVIRLSVEDQRRFVDLLLNPPPLPAALKRAKKAHARLIASSK
jgi:uncharacterized protein (DUF1778 family)